MKETLIKYFETFSNKDIEGLSRMFSDEVTLVDWDISETGIENVIRANKNIFQSVKTISVTPLKYYSSDDRSYAVEISILIDENETLDVVDIISFDQNGLINSIKAYKK